MENIRNKKFIYISICILVVLICIIGGILFDKNEKNDYNDFEIQETDTVNQITKKEKTDEEKLLYIHITGEVKNPGVVVAKEGERIKDVIEKAGGLTKEADISKVNLAYQICDGQKIIIPNINEKNNDEYSNNIEYQSKTNVKENNKSESTNKYIIQNSGDNIIVDGINEQKNQKVNINTATQTELETLDGIGPSTASKIIEHRKENGNFKNIEDIKNIKGIGESKYKKIENNITVR